MRHISSYEVRFDVGHFYPHPDPCSKQHGHPVYLLVGCAGAPLPEYGSFVVDMDALIRDVNEVTEELENRNLNEMIAPAQPTAAGLAGWVFHRLQMDYPVLAFVEVEMGNLTARVEAE